MIKKMTHFLCLGLLLLSNVMMLSKGSVLCIKADGSIAVERARGSCCASSNPESHLAAQVSSAHQVFILGQPKSCGDCTDLVLSGPRLRATRDALTAKNFEFDQNVASAQPLLSIPRFEAPRVLRATYRPMSLTAPVSVKNLTTSLQI